MKLTFLFLLLPSISVRSNAFLQTAVNILSIMPRFIQQNVYKIAHLDKEMDFIVQQNSIWVGYRIHNEIPIVDRLPPGMELVPIKVFPDSIPQKYVFFNFFSVNSTYLKGNRLEVVTVAFDPVTNRKRFVILDYFSDTISSDPENIFKRSNAKNMLVLRINDCLCAYMDDRYVFLGQRDKELRMLSSEFAIECNHNIFYGLKDKHMPNHLTFDEEKVSLVRMFSHFDVIMDLPWKDALYGKPEVSFYYPHILEFKIKTNKWWEENES